MPGTPPFTRGTKAVRDGLGWDIRTFHIEADPKAANAAIIEDLEGGVTSIGLQVRWQRTGANQGSLRSRTYGVLLDVCPIVSSPANNFVMPPSP